MSPATRKTAATAQGGSGKRRAPANDNDRAMKHIKRGDQNTSGGESSAATAADESKDQEEVDQREEGDLSDGVKDTDQHPEVVTPNGSEVEAEEGGAVVAPVQAVATPVIVGGDAVDAPGATVAPVVEPATPAPVIEPVTATPVVEPGTPAPVVEPATPAPVGDAATMGEPVTAAPLVVHATAAPVGEVVTAAPVGDPAAPAPAVAPPVNDPLVAALGGAPVDGPPVGAVAVVPQAAVGVPEMMHMNDFDYIPPQVIERLRRVAAYSHPAAQRYRLAQVDPERVAWGGFRGQWLCWNGHPITVLFVARLRTKRMYDNFNNVALNSARIRFKMLQDVDHDIANLLIRGTSSPAVVSTKRTFHASRSTVQYFRDDRPSVNYTFGEIFDGTTKFASKAKMTRIEQSALHANDVLLVEARVQRYGADNTRWLQGWTSTFYLDSITKLYAAPMTAPDEDESEVEEERVPTDDELDV